VEIALLRRECVLDAAAQPVLLIAAAATKGPHERMVPMSAFVLGELLGSGLPAAGWMFTRQDRRRGPNTPHRVGQLANAYLRDCGIAATLHQLRHRFGTQTYQSTRDLRAVQELMGHAKPETTAGYAAYANATAVEAVEAVPVPPGPRITPTAPPTARTSRC
jgi:integrase/recombinase XerC